VANPVSLLDNVDEEGEPEKPFDLAELVQHLSVFLNGSSVETVSISRFEKMGGRLEDGEAQLVGTRGAVGEIFYRKGSDVHRVYISSKETKSLGFRGGHDRENAVTALNELGFKSQLVGPLESPPLINAFDQSLLKFVA